MGAGRDNLAIDFSLTDIKGLVATHVYNGHVSSALYLLMAGFKGPVLCGESSFRLLPIVLEDAFRLRSGCDQQQVERYLELFGLRIILLPYDTGFVLADAAQPAIVIAGGGMCGWRIVD